jgi:hypothetical protein
MIVTVRNERSNQLNYVPTRQINEMRNRQCLCGFARFACRVPVAPDCPQERDSCPNRRRELSNPRRTNILTASRDNGKVRNYNLTAIPHFTRRVADFPGSQRRRLLFSIREKRSWKG